MCRLHCWSKMKRLQCNSMIMKSQCVGEVSRQQARCLLQTTAACAQLQIVCKGCSSQHCSRPPPRASCWAGARRCGTTAPQGADHSELHVTAVHRRRLTRFDITLPPSRHEPKRRSVELSIANTNTHRLADQEPPRRPRLAATASRARKGDGLFQR